ncbi:MAG: small ribosomal subunit Rsm22 family protein [Candidatus Sumerlaeales bacterium]|nr:small ribosomal subunit Rsm22 family protein [Candidatus Sumerlaeales bacterium]
MYEKILAVLEEMGHRRGIAELKKAFQDIGKWYAQKEKHQGSFVWNDNHYLSYALSRMPATYMVASRVLSEVSLIGDSNSYINSHLDLCSGPGTFSFALQELFQGLTVRTCIERAGGFIKLGKVLESAASDTTKGCINWQCADIMQADFPSADLVTIGYGLNELNRVDSERIVRKAYEATNKILVIADTGTPEDYDRLLSIRQLVVNLGATIIAPCMHSDFCRYREQISASGWCHFSLRVPRTRIQRFIKNGTQSFEDERYTWLVAAKDTQCHAIGDMRILNHPRKSNKGIDMTVCLPSGCVESITVPKRDVLAYKSLVKKQWGDCPDSPQKLLQ